MGSDGISRRTKLLCIIFDMWNEVGGVRFTAKADMLVTKDPNLEGRRAHASSSILNDEGSSLIASYARLPRERVPWVGVVICATTKALHWGSSCFCDAISTR